MNYRIRALQEGDCRSPFLMESDEDLPLKIYFRRDAEKAAASYITKTYVAVSEDDEDRRILGYISLMNAEVQIRGVHNIPDKPRANHYAFQPAVRIARLAVADDMQGKGIGSDLMSLGLTICLDRIVPVVGCRFAVVNAKQKSVPFYQDKFRFEMLDTESNKKLNAPVMWLDLKLYADG